MKTVFNKPAYLKFLIIFLVAILMTYCNPVKKVLNDPKKFDQVAEEVIRRGKCINDTVTRTVTKDSIVFRDSIITVVVDNYLPAECYTDTTFADGSRLIIKDGQVTFKYKARIPEKHSKTVKDNYIRDKALENILKKDIAVKNDSLKYLRNHIIKQEAIIGEQKTKITWAYVKFYALIIIIIIFGLLNLYNRFRAGLLKF